MQSRKIKHVLVSMPESFSALIDERRGMIQRATYVQELIKLAWQAGIRVPGEP